MPVTGGKKLAAFIKRAQKAEAHNVKSLEVGFFADARYQNQVPVTNVAAWNEFGTKGGGWGGPVPERPFFRNSLKDSAAVWMPIMEAEIDPKTMVVSKQTAGRLGLAMQNRIQREITVLKTPPNSPVTLERKKPKKNPLINTGFLRASVTYKVNL